MSARPATRERVKARAARLKAIEIELIKASRRKASELTKADKFRFAHAALMSFQAEVLRARLLAGQPVNTDELLRINAAVDAVLPHKPHKLQVEYLDSFICEDCGKKRTEKAAAEREAKRVPPPPEGGVALPNVIVEISPASRRAL